MDLRNPATKDSPPTEGKWYVLRTVDRPEVLFLPFGAAARTGTALALKNTLDSATSYWQLRRSGSGQLFLSNHAGRNADVDHAQWQAGTNVVIAPETPSQTWQIEEAGNQDGSYYIESLLGKNLEDSINDKVPNDIRLPRFYMGRQQQQQHDPNVGLVRWIVLQHKRDAARWWFLPVEPQPTDT